MQFKSMLNQLITGQIKVNTIDMDTEGEVSSSEPGQTV
jgi:hypothetical protein